MSVFKRFFVLFAVSFMVFSSFSLVCVGETGENDAASAVSAAESRVVECYRAVVDAEKAGANVSGLLVRLNEAGDLLSRAQLAYEVGNYDSAVNLASQSQAKLNGFVDDAGVLKADALRQGYWDFMVNVVGSSVGSVAIVLGGFVFWCFSKRKREGAGEAV